MGEGPSEQRSPADFARTARDARERAEAAGERAAELHAAGRRHATADHEIPASSDADLAHAQQRAEKAHEQLISALRRSADAHDRAADVLERSRPSSPQLEQRAQVHRRAATEDRVRADLLDRHDPAALPAADPGHLPDRS